MNDIRQRVAKAIADVIGHKQEEKCHPHAKAAIEAMKEELTLREEKLVEALKVTQDFMKEIQEDHKSKGRYYLPAGNTLLNDARYWQEKLQEILKELGINPTNGDV